MKGVNSPWSYFYAPNDCVKKFHRDKKENEVNTAVPHHISKPISNHP